MVRFLVLAAVVYLVVVLARKRPGARRLPARGDSLHERVLDLAAEVIAPHVGIPLEAARRRLGRLGPDTRIPQLSRLEYAVRFESREAATLTVTVSLGAGPAGRIVSVERQVPWALIPEALREELLELRTGSAPTVLYPRPA